MEARRAPIDAPARAEARPWLAFLSRHARRVVGAPRDLPPRRLLRALPDLLTYLLISAVIVFVFVWTGFVIFGNVVDQYRSVTQVAFSP